MLSSDIYNNWDISTTKQKNRYTLVEEKIMRQ